MLFCREFLSCFLDFRRRRLLARNIGAPQNQLLSIFYKKSARGSGDARNGKIFVTKVFSGSMTKLKLEMQTSPNSLEAGLTI